MTQMSRFNIWENIYATFFFPVLCIAEGCMNYSCWGFSNFATARKRISFFAFVVISEASSESGDIQFSVLTDAVHESSL